MLVQKRRRHETDASHRTDEEEVAWRGGDFDSNSLPDLAVTASSPGRVWVYSGTTAGPAPQVDVILSKVPPTRGGEVVEEIGNGLAAGDLDGDGDDDLAVGTGMGRIDSTGTDVGAIPGLFIVPGSTSGLQPDRRRFIAGWRTPGLRPPGGTISSGFGHRLAVTDFDRDGHHDLAVAAPYDQSNYGRPGIRGYLNPGNVYVLYGTKHGLDGSRRQIWSQRTRGITGQAKKWEGFGVGGLQILDVDNGRSGDLVVHSPRDRSGRGTVSVVYGAHNGLRAAGAQLWHQDTPGILGVGEHTDEGSDGFGTL